MVQRPHIGPISLVFWPIRKFNLPRMERGSFSVPFSPAFSAFLQHFPVGKGRLRGSVVVGGGVASPLASHRFSAQITPDSLIYRTLLNYDPSPASNPVIIRSNPAVIPIECHYPR